MQIDFVCFIKMDILLLNSQKNVELMEKLKEILKVLELYFIRSVSLKYKYANEIRRRYTPPKI